MKSKYENRAKEIITEALEWLEGDYDMSEDETRSILKAMCNLGEEVEKEYKLTTHELNVKIEDNVSDEIKRDILEFNNNLYTKEQVEELLNKQREFCAKNAKLNLFDYTKDSFKETKLNKTHYSIDDGNYLEIDKNSILNAKLKLD